MGKKVILTESQFKDYMRSIKKNLNEARDNARYLEFDEKEALLHKMIDNDFACYFKNGKQFICSNIKDKAEILYDVAYLYPAIDETGMIRIMSDKYGTYHITNLISAKM